MTEQGAVTRVKNPCSFSDRYSKTVFGVTILTSSHREIRRLGRENIVPSIHGHRFWGSSYLIMDYLIANPLRKGARVLDIGCGWGIGGIFCAREFSARVTGVDADADVFPFLKLHAEINGVSIATEQWKFQQLKADRLKREEVMIGADICFWDELVDPLYNLLRRARKAGVKKIVLADPGRSTFRTLCERSEKHLGGRAIDWRVKNLPRAAGTLLVIE